MITYLIVMMFILPNGTINLEKPVIVDFTSYNECMTVTEMYMQQLSQKYNNQHAGWECHVLSEINILTLD